MAHNTKRDRSTQYLAVLVEKRGMHAMHLHAGLARYGIGRTFCEDPRPLFEFELAARDPKFALHLEPGWRHRYAEAMLELNRGCPACLEQLYAIGREVGYRVPKELAA